MMIVLGKLEEPLLSSDRNHVYDEEIDHSYERRGARSTDHSRTSDRIKLSEGSGMFAPFQKLKKMVMQTEVPPDELYGLKILEMYSDEASKISVAHRLHRNFLQMNYVINGRPRKNHYSVAHAVFNYPEGPKHANIRFADLHEGHWHLEMRDPLALVGSEYAASEFTLDDMRRFTYTMALCSHSPFSVKFIANVRNPVTTKIGKNRIEASLQSSLEQSGDLLRDTATSAASP